MKAPVVHSWNINWHFQSQSASALSWCHRFTMLPFDNREYKQGQGNASLMEGKFPDYMRRLCDFRQMDFEAAFDQILTLISLEPQQM